MVHYKIIKTCRLCKTRFTVGKEGARRNYCEKCEESYKAAKALEAEQAKANPEKQEAED